MDDLRLSRSSMRCSATATKTNDDLAELAGLSASQCSRRRAVLEEDGVIEGYHAKLSAEKLGLKVQVFVQVTLATHSPDNSKRFAKLINELDEVQEAYSLTGERRLRAQARRSRTCRRCRAS